MFGGMLPCIPNSVMSLLENKPIKSGCSYSLHSLSASSSLADHRSRYAKMKCCLSKIILILFMSVSFKDDEHQIMFKMPSTAEKNVCTYFCCNLVNFLGQEILSESRFRKKYYIIEVLSGISTLTTGKFSRYFSNQHL